MRGFTSPRFSYALIFILLAAPAGALLATQDAALIADDAAPAGPPATPVFGAPVIVAHTFGFEPSVQVDSTGVIYVSFAKGLPVQSWTYRSTNGGASWQKLANVPGTQNVGAEPEIALAEDDTLYVADMYLGNTLYAWYSNHGQSLDGFHLVGQPTAGIDRPWITVGAKAVTGGHEMWLTSLDVGRGVFQYYTPDATVAPPSKPQPIVIGGGPSQHPVYDPVNKWAYTIYEATGGIFVARTNGLQAQPTRFLVTNQFSEISNVFPMVATDKAGNVYATWTSEESGRHAVFLTWSTDQGMTWATPRLVTTSGTATFPWIAANEPGRVVVAYYGADEAAHPHNVVGDWEVRVAQSVDVLSGNPTFAVAKATGTVHSGGICVDGSACGLSPPWTVDRDLGDYIQVDIDPSTGMTHVAYTDDFINQEPRIYHVQQVGGTPS